VSDARPASPHIREVGDAALLVELEAVIDEAVNARAIAIADAVRAAAIEGVRDVVPTFRSVAVYFDPLNTEVEVLKGALATLCAASPGTVSGSLVEVPVSYGGDAGVDLAAVAAWSGLTADEVIERHLAPTYRVFMLGFLPGFAYMGVVDPAIAAPRRVTPRMRVPAGSVGIAGRQTGIYPRESPGGWQLIGRSSMQMFDVRRHPASLLAPGDRVKFVREESKRDAAGPIAEADGGVRRNVEDVGTATITVVDAGLLTTIQDLGRWGQQSTGVSVSGAMDPVAHRTANALVGNAPADATIEATLSGPTLRCEVPTTIAIAGADLGAEIDGAQLPPGRSREVAAGAVLRFGQRRAGARVYIACEGGFDVAPVLGSRATHLPSALGGLQGRPLRAGDHLKTGPGRRGQHRGRTGAGQGQDRGRPRGGARLRILPGPQNDFFTPDALDLLQRGRYVITPHANRMGYRLSGPALPSASHEMISDATFAGAVQVPPSGEPILLMADRQTVGGYPQIAIVISADLPHAGQLAPGDWVEFEICTRRDALAALVAQEGMLA